MSRERGWSGCGHHPLSHRGSPQSDSEKPGKEGGAGGGRRLARDTPAQDTAPHPGSYLSSVQEVPEHVACAPRAQEEARREVNRVPRSMIAWDPELPAGGGKRGGGRPRLQGAVSSVVEQGRGRQGRGCGRKERHGGRGQKQRQPFVLAAHRSKFYCKYRSCFFPKADIGVGEADQTVGGNA